MTTPDDTPFPGTGYLQLGIPGVPYSAIRVPIINDLEQDNLWIEHAVLIATLTAKVYKEAFPQKDVPQGTVYERDDPGGAWAPPPPQQARPQAHQRPPQAQGTRRATELDPRLVVHGNCPDHGIPARPSKMEYQEVEIDAETGEERYSKYYCNSPEGRHSLWARQLVQQ